MKYLVGYDGGEPARRALALACEQAKSFRAMIYVVASMVGGPKEDPKEIAKAGQALESAEAFLLVENVQCETLQLVRGLSPGEDLVKFAEDNAVDAIFIGINKKSRTRKILLGSTAQYIILRGPCPVTTTK